MKFSTTDYIGVGNPQPTFGSMNIRLLNMACQNAGHRQSDTKYNIYKSKKKV